MFKSLLVPHAGPEGPETAHFACVSDLPRALSPHHNQGDRLRPKTLCECMCVFVCVCVSVRVLVTARVQILREVKIGVKQTKQKMITMDFTPF